MVSEGILGGHSKQALGYSRLTHTGSRLCVITKPVGSHLEAIQRALASEGAYYAFFYYRAVDHISDIDFFLVDLVNNRLYLVNHNT